jgi:hypothetical protein
MIDLGTVSKETLGVPTPGFKDDPADLPNSGEFMPN